MLPAKDRDETVWRALADGWRRRLLDVLAEGPKTTGHLVESLPELSRTAVMRHLDVLEEAGLLIVRREGRQRWNRLNPVPIDRVCRRWLDRNAGRWASALNRLDELVSEDS